MKAYDGIVRVMVTEVVALFKSVIFVTEQATGTCCESQIVTDKTAGAVIKP